MDSASKDSSLHAEEMGPVHTGMKYKVFSALAGASRNCSDHFYRNRRHLFAGEELQGLRIQEVKEGF